MGKTTPPEATLFTVGFTRRSAEGFFSTLADAGVKRVIDIRLHNVSQLAGFAKRDDLVYFLKTICGIEYLHRPDLAPSAELLDCYRKKEIAWPEFEASFGKLMRERGMERLVDRATLDRGCLLCSEHDPAHCHRRLVAEYLQHHFGNMRICHL